MTDLDEIKKEVIPPRSPPKPMASEPLPHEIIDLEKMVEETPKIAPLFVKIEKYKEILKDIKNLKSEIKNMQILLAYKKQVQSIGYEIDKTIFKILQNFTDLIDKFSMNFSMPRGVNYVSEESKTVHEESVSNIGNRIEKLKEKLDRIEI